MSRPVRILTYLGISGAIVLGCAFSCRADIASLYHVARGEQLMDSGRYEDGLAAFQCAMRSDMSSMYGSRVYRDIRTSLAAHAGPRLDAAFQSMLSGPNHVSQYYYSHLARGNHSCCDTALRIRLERFCKNSSHSTEELIEVRGILHVLLAHQDPELEKILDRLDQDEHCDPRVMEHLRAARQTMESRRR